MILDANEFNDDDNDSDNDGVMMSHNIWWPCLNYVHHNIAGMLGHTGSPGY